MIDPNEPRLAPAHEIAGHFEDNRYEDSRRGDSGFISIPDALDDTAID